MQQDREQWRGIFEMAQDYKKAPSGIFEELQQGQIRYTDPELIATGGMKEIYSVQDNTTGRKVALAILKNESPTNKELFLRESRITAFLQHPNIMPVYDMGLDDGNTPYFTMKLSRGESLHQIIKKLRAKDPKYRKEYPLTVLVQIFRKICDAVASAHFKGVIHLDIKPDNIQISNYGEVLLCDWGLSKITNIDVEAEESLADMDSLDLSDIQTVTRHDHVKGTPGFMAPEQANPRQGKRNERTDIFSLGALLYSLLTFEIPIKGRNTQDVIRKTAQGKVIPPKERTKGLEIPNSLEAVSLKAMARLPKKRYKNVEQMINDIDSWQNGFATEAEDASLIKQLFLIYHRNKLISNTVIAFFLVIFGLLSTFVLIQQGLVKEITEREKDTQAALSSFQKEKDEKENLLLEKQLVNLKQAWENNNYSRIRDIMSIVRTLAPDDPDINSSFAKLSLINQNFNGFATAVKKSNDPGLKSLLSKIKKHLFNYYEKPALRNSLIYLICEEVETYNEAFASDVMNAYFKKIKTKAEQISMINALLKESNSTGKDYSIDYSVTLNGPFLNLAQNKNLKSLKSLRFFKFYKLDLAYTSVSNLELIKNMKVNILNISHTPVMDLSPLKQSSLRELYMDNTRIKKIMYLKDVPLTHISLLNTKVHDISSLNRIQTLQTITLKRQDYILKNLKKLQKKLTY
jgi:serine/threonine protein kinase